MSSTCDQSDRQIVEARLRMLRSKLVDLEGHGQHSQAIVLREDIARVEKRLHELVIRECEAGK